MSTNDKLYKKLIDELVLFDYVICAKICCPTLKRTNNMQYFLLLKFDFCAGIFTEIQKRNAMYSVRFCLDRLFRQLQFRRLNWNSLNKRSRQGRTKSNSL